MSKPPRPENEALFVQDGFRIAVWTGRSDGTDGAFVVFVDTNFEPDGSDGGPGLRLSINDDDTYVGTPYGYEPEEVEDNVLRLF